LATAAGLASSASASRVVERRAAVADLGQQFRRRDDGAFEQREQDRAVGMLADGCGDLPLEFLDLPVSEFGHRDQRQHQLPPGAQLVLTDATLGRLLELGQQHRGLLASPVALTRQELGQAGFAQPARVVRLG
jgi:hypothetical protein